MTPEFLLALLLAQTCVAEISFGKDVSECVLMWQINADNAERKGRTLRHQTLLYNGYWKSPKQQQNRAFIKELRDDKKPKSWPANMGWKRHRPMWMAYLTAALNFIEKPPNNHLCPGAIDYGAVGECPGNGKEQYRCLDGNTKQIYWARKPRRSQRGINYCQIALVPLAPLTLEASGSISKSTIIPAENRVKCLSE